MKIQISFRTTRIAVAVVILMSLIGCGEKHNNWHRLPDVNFALPPYVHHLEGIKICLDPGHGGQAHLPNYKRGPTGLREAAVNLKVARYLREFLVEAGALVFMTRVDDSFISIPDRCEIANQNSVVFFISLHHNFSTDSSTNYTSTWYHRDADDSPAGLDLARYIQQGVAETLRLPQFPATGLYSDQLLIPSGFGVLRLTTCTAILCEASFYSNAEEEKRLRQQSYNRREAYGYFLGIARYVAAGFPKGILVMPASESAVETKTPRIQIRIMDGLHERGGWMLKRQQVLSGTIRVKLDGVVVPHRYLRAKDLVAIEPKKPLSNGVHFIETAVINYYGNHSLPRVQWFKVAPPAAKMAFRAWTDTIPPDGESYVGITVTAIDRDGLPIADDEPIHAQTSLGRLSKTTQLSKNGVVRFYLHTGTTQPEPGVARVKAAYKSKSDTIDIRFGNISGGIIQGPVQDTAETPLSAAAVRLVREKNKKTTETDVNGHFFFNGIPPGEVTLQISKAGYYEVKLNTKAVADRAQILHPALPPIAEGTLIGQVFVLDARYGGTERGAHVTDSVATADLNFAVVKVLKEMLEIAGSKVYLIREEDETIPVAKRVEAVNAINQEGYYLRIDHGRWVEGEPSVIAASYPGNKVAADLLTAILEQFNIALFGTPIETVGDLKSPEIRWTNKAALTLELRSINHPHLDEPPNSPAQIAQEGYTIFLGMAQFLKDGALSPTQLQIQVVDQISQQPVAGARIALDNTFPLVTDRAGRVVFRGIEARRYRVVIQAAGYTDQEIEADSVKQEPLVVAMGRVEQPVQAESWPNR